jgi:phage shock protein A
MNKHRSASQAVTTATLLLSGQLDGLMAAWERAIETERDAKPNTAPTLVPTEPTAAIATLEREIVTLDLEITRLRTQADDETQRALDWDQRAMLAVRAGRIGLAKDASRHAEVHRGAAEALTAEVSATTEATDSARRALSAMRALTH